MEDLFKEVSGIVKQDAELKGVQLEEKNYLPETLKIIKDGCDEIMGNKESRDLPFDCYITSKMKDVSFTLNSAVSEVTDLFLEFNMMINELGKDLDRTKEECNRAILEAKSEINRVIEEAKTKINQEVK